jgi:sensory rhodopsin
MTTLTTWFVLGTAGMVLGTVALAWGYTRLPEEPRRDYLALIAVTLIAAVAYALMALDIGGVTSARGELLYVPRYVDWLLTTPLHVAYLGLLVGSDRETIGKLVGLMGATITLGFAGGMVAGPLNLLLFAAGSLAFVGVVYLLYSDVAADAADCGGQRRSLFGKLRTFVVVLWLVYPVIWLLSGPGYVLMDTETASLVVTYIDVVAKVGFGLIAFNGLQTIYGTGAATADGDHEAVAAD